MKSDLISERLGVILRTAMADEEEEFLFVVSSVDATEAFIEEAINFDGTLPRIRVLAGECTLTDVMDDFMAASKAADLVADGIIDLRVAEDPPGDTFILTDESVVVTVDAGTKAAGMVNRDGDFIEALSHCYENAWGSAEEYTFRIAPISEVRETLKEDVSPEVEADFDSIFNSLSADSGDTDEIDEVAISLLVAAKHEEFLYDISRWGEEVRIGSRSKFSRLKGKLEDEGLIDTEKVQVEVGRPRLRLKIDDDHLQGAKDGEFSTALKSALS